MATLKRPGVFVDEVLSTNNTVSGISLSTAAFVGPNGRGPIVPTLVRSWTEYTNLYGGFGTSNLPYALFTYFSNGGRDAYVQRVVGTGAVTATVTLADRAGSPLPTLRVDAHNPGGWGNALYVSIVDAGTGRFDLVVRHGGTTDAFIVERWADVSMVSTDPRYVVSLVNSPTAGSTYIKVADLGSATVAPGNTPAVATNTPLATGADGAAPTTTQISTGISGLDIVAEPFGLNLPGDSTVANVNAAIAYAAARGDVFVVVDTAPGRTAAQAVTDAAALTASSYAAVYYPWVHMADPSSTRPGATRLTAPGAAVLGQYATTDATRGVHKTPAGINTRLSGAVGIETKFTNADLDALNVGAVNAIRHIPGAGVVVMGGRTLKSGTSDKYLSIRRSLIYIKKALLDGTQFAIFEPNDELLWEQLSDRVGQFLHAFWQSGGLRGSSPQEAFYVKCDEEINTPAVIAAGEVRMEVGVALQYPAEFVVIKIGQFEGGGNAVEA